MIGFWITNLLPPGGPQQFDVITPAGTWSFEPSANYLSYVQPVQDGGCANTYSVSFALPTGSTRLSTKDQAFHEALPLCLGASFAMGAAITASRSTDFSEIQFMTVGSHFPRARGIPTPWPCVTKLAELVKFLETFVARFNTLNPTEKLLLLTHFHLDAIACWSLEDLYLSGSTLLQIIAETEKSSGRPDAAAHAKARGLSSPGFFDYLTAAADRAGIARLAHDVVKIRNSLIHEGSLKRHPFTAKDQAAAPIAEAMQWVDAYVFSILGLGAPPAKRYDAKTLASLNSFSF